jgi:hypothetical protein
VLRALGKRADAEFGAKPADLEAEFFTAANLAVDVSDAGSQRELRARKSKLGRSYFAPGMLRAVVTYNMALQQSMQPWTCAPDGAEDPSLAPAPAATGSLFGSGALASLHSALKQRIDGEPLQRGPVHRVAWALGLDDLGPAELTSLRDGALETSELRCAVILVGLLCRSLNVLGIELQEIGIDPDTVSEGWTEELDQLVKIEVNDSIMDSASGAAYEEARGLSELRNRFLFDSMKSVNRKARGNRGEGRAAQADFEERQVRKEARALASQAVSGEERPRAPRSSGPRGVRHWPWRLAVPATAIVVLAVGMALQLLGVIDLLGRGLDRWDRDELAAVSEYLVDGHRNGDGNGVAFVGTIDESWLALSSAEREATAEQLVTGLREHGVSQVMIYDAERTLRIQGLGRIVRTL